MKNIHIQVCERDGECVTAKESVALDGNYVVIFSDEVQAVVDSITEADDELQREDIPWEDNFNLKSLRSLRRGLRDG